MSIEHTSRPAMPATVALCLALAASPAAAEMTEPHAPRASVQLTHPEWSRHAAIYQLNLRQFTDEGTFRAAARHLPRLKALGVEILWLMPIHPIGEKHRKGSLGSPYSVKDYYGVNPEFGTLEDLRRFVAAAHAAGLYVILDWVANHTAWDNPLVEAHPDWYLRDWEGDFRPTPWWDWSDIIELDYAQPELRHYMVEAMKYWVREADIDGYRCDVAGYVPVDFWNRVRRELDAIKPVFMLAEWESRDLHVEAFDATYAWSWYEKVHAIAEGRADANALRQYYAENEKAHPRDAYRMTFVSNHDKNAWEGTQFEAFGPALENAIALSIVGEGLPLVYNGQEAGNPKRLAFFEKDPIEWREHPVGALYQRLLSLRKATGALANGAAGARMVPVFNDSAAEVLSFVRSGEADAVFAVFNFSGEAREVAFEPGPHHGAWRDHATGEGTVFEADTVLALPAWTHRIYVR